jgi:hypothetical protein
MPIFGRCQPPIYEMSNFPIQLFATISCSYPPTGVVALMLGKALCRSMGWERSVNKD